jgi:hypothetical protein
VTIKADSPEPLRHLRQQRWRISTARPRQAFIYNPAGNDGAETWAKVAATAILADDGFT